MLASWYGLGVQVCLPSILPSLFPPSRLSFSALLGTHPRVSGMLAKSSPLHPNYPLSPWPYIKGLCVVLAVLSLYVDGTGFELTQVHLPMPPKCWIKGIGHNARLHVCLLRRGLLYFQVDLKFLLLGPLSPGCCDNH